LASSTLADDVLHTRGAEHRGRARLHDGDLRDEIEAGQRMVVARR